MTQHPYYQEQPATADQLARLNLRLVGDLAGYHVYLVDGDAVRQKHTADDTLGPLDDAFMESSNSRTAAYIPSPAIWIDSGSFPEGWKFLAYRERLSARLQEAGWTLGPAEEEADRLTGEWRREWDEAESPSTGGAVGA